MANAGIVLCLIFLAFEARLSASQNITRGSFPKGFVFGTASSAYQYEGAVKEDGRGMTIWDTFARKFGKVSDFSNGDIAVDQYHRYPEDIQLMKDMGMDAYRFSIAWSRIFPNGTGPINQAGVDHYNNLINALLAKDVGNFFSSATHQITYDWLTCRNDFAIYAETCFQKFGDRVKHWITFNEPHTFAVQGYTGGLQAPGRCSILSHLLCKDGNSSTEPYIAGHNVLLSHAAVVDVYRRKYKAKQKGSVGVSFDVIWYEPATNSTKDIEATQRAQDFQLGWFLDPLMFGDYPKNNETQSGRPLTNILQCRSCPSQGIPICVLRECTQWNMFIIPLCLIVLFFFGPAFRGLKPIGDRANAIWLYIVPGGMRSLMNYIKQKYDNPTVIITENGMDDPNNLLIPLKDALKDEKRIRYHNDYLTNLLAAIKEDGCNVKGYFAWSLLDNWEWSFGFTSRFGLYFVEYNNNRTRHAKDSDVMKAGEDLESSYAGTNLARKSALLRELSDLVQNGMPLCEYNRKLNSLYREIDAIKTSRCYATENCLCCKQINEEKHEDRVVKFVMDLMTAMPQVFAVEFIGAGRGKAGGCEEGGGAIKMLFGFGNCSIRLGKKGRVHPFQAKKSVKFEILGSLDIKKWERLKQLLEDGMALCLGLQIRQIKLADCGGIYSPSASLRMNYNSMESRFTRETDWKVEVSSHEGEDDLLVSSLNDGQSCKGRQQRVAEHDGDRVRGSPLDIVRDSGSDGKRAVGFPDESRVSSRVRSAGKVMESGMTSSIRDVRECSWDTTLFAFLQQKGRGCAGKGSNEQLGAALSMPCLGERGRASRMIVFSVLIRLSALRFKKKESKEKVVHKLQRRKKRAELVSLKKIYLEELEKSNKPFRCLSQEIKQKMMMKKEEG
ncbi:unnamed protein product [Rhodiola kirilowii]